MMESRTFTSGNGLELIIKSRKSAVILEMEQSKTNDKYHFTFEFNQTVFMELLEYIEVISNKSWSNLNPKECDSLGADYYEYYDRPLDNNGYLDISKYKLGIERPSLESGRLYQFNKKKMESFIYDFKKIIESIKNTDKMRIN
ncbi:hypothetical protein COE48_27060 [Bacillus thuringiensis]|uniref:Uncharacterized protein n=2 Tax=Bacillus thuringiensis TaxID=1428 RepID=A0AB36V3L3_BACTU|nr:hypothetical protein CN283_11230 [Bacillus thuringiensis]PGY99988.1 hypothetical protein COE48_27060 [Bacillus thuringiensis]